MGNLVNVVRGGFPRGDEIPLFVSTSCYVRGRQS